MIKFCVCERVSVSGSQSLHKKDEGGGMRGEMRGGMRGGRGEG